MCSRWRRSLTRPETERKSNPKPKPNPNPKPNPSQVATLSDNTTMLVPAAQLNLTNLRTSSLLLAVPGAGDDAVGWSVTVSQDAVRECGMLLLAQWGPCGGAPTAALVEVFLQLPEPKTVRVSGVHVSGTAAQQAWA